MPTVTTFFSIKIQYGRSLFERLYQSGHPVHFLDRQFRCHPDIYTFPSESFYNGRVTMGRNRNSFSKFYHHYVAFQPIIFFDLQIRGGRKGQKSNSSNSSNSSSNSSNSSNNNTNGGQSQSNSTKSFQNVDEAKFCASLLKSLIQISDQHNEQQMELKQKDPRHVVQPSFGSVRNPLDPETSIGIITPYRDQVNALQRSIRKEMTQYWNDKGRRTGMGRKRYTPKETFKVSSVDGFQGQERECIIFSTVRTDGVGFSQDVQRLCVALTRAKYTLMIVGNYNNLNRSRAWSGFLEYLTNMGRVVRVKNAEVDPLSLGLVSEQLFEMLEGVSGEKQNR